MNKTCNNCQYFRDADFSPNFVDAWCSNIKSEYVLSVVGARYTCDEFAKRGEKAPLWMRLANRILEWLNKKI